MNFFTFRKSVHECWTNTIWIFYLMKFHTVHTIYESHALFVILSQAKKDTSKSIKKKLLETSQKINIFNKFGHNLDLCILVGDLTILCSRTFITINHILHCEGFANSFKFGLDVFTRETNKIKQSKQINIIDT